MAVEEQQIECRNCHEEIPIDSGECPHCGTSVRKSWVWIVVVLLGLILAVPSLVGGDIFFGAIGLLLAVSGGALLYEKRQRIR